MVFPYASVAVIERVNAVPAVAELTVLKLNFDKLPGLTLNELLVPVIWPSETVIVMLPDCVTMTEAVAEPSTNELMVDGLITPTEHVKVGVPP